ncbi:hypothetical protein BDY21DRAFT_374438 [Lineolata rhizophorae]|uniref:Sm domain-containing protein n=1 Tax=Lineolata rhizophorae TaxID=578093 RepID=A0A6A6NRH9_9PEZI|nr:hypothetical protein BDY21DRAFT_374438 [Lineolata rhizophorae]
MPDPAIEAGNLLANFLGKTLRIHTQDRRMFVGQMKCTDKDCNIVLALTHEYRMPSEDSVRAAAENTETDKFNVSMPHRFVGLVVVPGKYITKIAVEGIESAVVEAMGLKESDKIS